MLKFPEFILTLQIFFSCLFLMTQQFPWFLNIIYMVMLPQFLITSLFLTTEHSFPTAYHQWHPTPVLWPGKSHGWKSLVGCSPWGCEESDTTERLHFHFSLSCIGEGNGNPLQCSCLENPRDGGARRAAVSGVTQSRTRLKWLSSSSSINISLHIPQTPQTNISRASFFTFIYKPLSAPSLAAVSSDV